MKTKLFTLLFIAFTSIATLYAQRQILNLNNGWEFRYGYEVNRNKKTKINLPHTWNTKDALGGNIDYYRGLGVYTKTLEIKQAWEGKRLTIRFLGANLVANVFINGKHVGEHRGGYTAFAFDITPFVNFGKENLITVKVNNAPQLDVMPLLGDFNFYGGLYRDVQLYVTEHDCISLLDHGSEGVYLHQDKVDNDSASVRAVVKLLGENTVKVNVTVLDDLGNETFRASQVKNDKNDQITIPIEINEPHLWNGTLDPYLYSVKVQLEKDKKIIDEVIVPLGLRYFHVDPDKGVFLNGEYVQLKGVCRHQDRPELGNALASFHHQEDVEIMKDMGANALRMAHYPNDPYMYELTNTEGFLVWSEIPFVGPGGYADKGYVDMPSFKENGKDQLIEMIRQNLNHPSILFWGLFNELKEDGDNPVAYIKELQNLANAEDPSRITTSASNRSGEINTITDLIAWNLYFGWYGGNPSGIGKWADGKHAEMPDTPIGISEYGAGASILHQSEELKKTNPGSYWHPENWQTYFHEEHWEQIDERPFIWGSFIWNLFDFGAAHRTEGEKDGKNDKGIVSFDRKDKKDAFYFYKANWNKNDPMIHIAERRLIHRTKVEQTIKVYSNQKKVRLWVNGKEYTPSSNTADYSRFYFNVTLLPGENKIIATGKKGLKDVIRIHLKKH
ncbi:glycoside hydrolase family 2 protein [Maribacter sp. 2304DJ31-5]|uniref:beta-glucuronidase LacZ4 n=1 Tax=Maribacter sp. 2304DJ31-5 TaxID=3386273 RepID=UPI0039BC9C82